MADTNSASRLGSASIELRKSYFLKRASVKLKTELLSKATPPNPGTEHKELYKVWLLTVLVSRTAILHASHAFH